MSSLTGFADPAPELGVRAARNVTFKVSSRDRGSTAVPSQMSAVAEDSGNVPLRPCQSQLRALSRTLSGVSRCLNKCNKVLGDRGWTPAPSPRGTGTQRSGAGGDASGAELEKQQCYRSENT